MRNLEAPSAKNKQSHEERSKLVLPDFIVRHLKGSSVVPTCVCSFDDAPHSKSAVAYEIFVKD